jgi:hypothetical protein
MFNTLYVAFVRFNVRQPYPDVNSRFSSNYCVPKIWSSSASSFATSPFGTNDQDVQ